MTNFLIVMLLLVNQQQPVLVHEILLLQPILLYRVLAILPLPPLLAPILLLLVILLLMIILNAPSVMKNSTILWPQFIYLFVVMYFVYSALNECGVLFVQLSQDVALCAEELFTCHHLGGHYPLVLQLSMLMKNR